MPDKILRALRWTCLLLAGTICWQVYGIVTAPEPFDRIGDLALEDLARETPPPETAGQTNDAESASKSPADGKTTAPADGKTTAPATSATDAGKPEGGDQKKADQKKGDQKKGDQKKGDQKKGDQKKGDQKKIVSPPFPATLEIVATSGILGKAPAKKPPPPTLLGTLGKYAMIRSPDGKEDLVAEGGVLGGVKVIKISTNRVLIEYQDRRTELTVYSGMGSPTLLEPEKKAEEKKKADAPRESTSKDSEGTPRMTNDQIPGPNQ